MRRNFIPRLATRNLEYNGISTELPAIFSSLFSSSSRTGGAKGLKRGGGTRGGQAEILTEKSWTSTRGGRGTAARRSDFIDALSRIALAIPLPIRPSI